MSCLPLPALGHLVRPTKLLCGLVEEQKEKNEQLRYDSAIEVAVPTLPLPRQDSKASSMTCSSPRSDRHLIDPVTVREVEENLPAPRLAIIPTTLTYWTSTDTRRREYAAIDRASRGLRGLARKFCFRSRQSTFYDEKAGSDAGSVRRYRLDLDALDEMAQAGPSPEGALIRRPTFAWRLRNKKSRNELSWNAVLGQFRKPHSWD